MGRRRAPAGPGRARRPPPRPGHWSIPAEATIRRTLARLDADALAGAIGAWPADRDSHQDRDRGGPATRRRTLAVDGTTLRGARAAGGDGRPVHLLEMDHASRAVLTQRQVDGAPEEVPAFAPLLAPLDLAGVAVTADATADPPRCRRVPGHQQAGAHLFTVKASQPLLLDRCAAMPWHNVPVDDRTRGRVELRALKVVSVQGFGFPHATRSSRSPARPASCTLTGGRP